MTQLRQFMKQGDIPKAKMLATQLAHYRNIADKNYARSVFIETETQMRISNHKINQAHISFLKGMNFANQGESLDAIRLREHKYHERQDLQQTMEDLMNHGLDGAYEEQESERRLPEYFDDEVKAIVREAQDKNLCQRDYVLGKFDSIKELLDNNVILNLKVFDSVVGEIPGREAGVSVPNLNISIEALKRYILKDPSIVKNLRIEQAIQPSDLQLGLVECEGETDFGSFVGFRSHSSLQEIGLVNNDTLWVDDFDVFGDTTAEEQRELEKKLKIFHGAVDCSLLSGRRLAFLRKSHRLLFLDVLGASECAGIKAMVQTATLTSQRHDAFATRDIPIVAADPLYDTVAQRVLRPMECHFGFCNGDLEFLDLFVVQYDCEAGGQTELGLHTDGCLLSFNILISHPDEYQGGGTFFPDLEPQVVLLDQGQAVCHESRRRHAGLRISSGKRIILVGFVETKRRGPLSKQGILARARRATVSQLG
ncbi:hypothetical protein HDU91_007340 [Kappamyces sp. JEL0680]|nr:hypothetical protein HDU91_007340 [Kappamyces sp. JEL0680]